MGAGYHLFVILSILKTKVQHLNNKKHNQIQKCITESFCSSETFRDFTNAALLIVKVVFFISSFSHSLVPPYLKTPSLLSTRGTFVSAPDWFSGSTDGFLWTDSEWKSQHSIAITQGEIKGGEEEQPGPDRPTKTGSKVRWHSLRVVVVNFRQRWSRKRNTELTVNFVELQILP